MRKTEQDKSLMKILTFCQDLCKSQFSRNRNICANSESRMMTRILKLESTRKNDQDKSLLKFLTFGQSQSVSLSQISFKLFSTVD